jgi:hypothetical protein
MHTDGEVILGWRERGNTYLVIISSVQVAVVFEL